jgi:hypothetical protein
MYGQTVFLVDDLLIGSFVLPVVRGLGERTVDAAYGWLGDQGVQLGRGLFWRLTKRRPGGESAERERLVRNLGVYVEQHPDAAPRLTAAAIKDAAAGATTDEEFLGVLLRFLTTVFELVDTLNRPAVLPGFLTGTEHLAVIDVRASNSSEERAMPTIASHQNDAPRLVFATRGLPYGDRSVLPRIWLVRATEEARRALEQGAASAAHYFDRHDAFSSSLQGQWLVTGIARRKVWVHQPDITHVGLFVKEASRDQAWDWSESPDGVIAMHRALVAAVREQVAKDNAWVDAWSQALRDGQAPGDSTRASQAQSNNPRLR